MQANLINHVSYVPLSQPVKGRIFAVGYGSQALPGGAASTPAQADTPQRAPHTRPTSPKEHPAEISTGLPVLAPAREPSDGSTPG